MPEQLVPRFIEALHHRERGWDEFVHEEAEFALLPFGGRTIRGRSLIARVLNSPAMAFYRPQVLDAWLLGPETLLVRGRAVYPLPGRGHAIGSAYWLDELRDGLVWRARGY